MNAHFSATKIDNLIYFRHIPDVFVGRVAAFSCAMSFCSRDAVVCNWDTAVCSWQLIGTSSLSNWLGESARLLLLATSLWRSCDTSVASSLENWSVRLLLCDKNVPSWLSTCSMRRLVWTSFCRNCDKTIISWFSVCSVRPRLPQTSLPGWMTSHVGCDDVICMTITTHSCSSISNISAQRFYKNNCTIKNITIIVQNSLQVNTTRMTRS